MVDLLKLNISKLFAVEGRREEDETVRREFSAFLEDYILRYALKGAIFKKMSDIMVREAKSGVVCMQMKETHEDACYSHIT